MLKKTIQHIVKDSRFNIDIEPAATALRQARAALEWAEKNERDLDKITEKIALELKSCLPNVS